MKKTKKQYYIVVHGHKPGLYTEWFGSNGAANQVVGFPEAIYKGFYTKEDALEWLNEYSRETLLAYAPNLLDLLDFKSSLSSPADDIALLQIEKIVVHTDGCAIQNPGPGGFAVILRHKGRTKEITGGFQNTTNNRMELKACIEGLKALKEKCEVIIFSDSKYVVDGITNGWVEKWNANGWLVKKGQSVANMDLWKELSELCKQHNVEFRWVRGHNINKDNERCDVLASAAAKKPNLKIDEGFSNPLSSTIFDEIDDLWSNEENQKLTDYFIDGADIKTLAIHLGKEESVVISQLARLGLLNQEHKNG